MKNTLEYKILKYLFENNNGNPIEVSQLHSDKESLKKSLSNLKKDKLINAKAKNNENIIAKIEFKGIKYLNEIENKNITNIFSESTIGQFNQDSNLTNSTITNSTIANPKTDLKADSIMLKFWKLISENKLVSSLLVVVILWLIKRYFNIDFKI